MSFKNPADFNPKARVMSFTVHINLPSTDAATAAMYDSVYWIAPAKCVVDSVDARWGTASTSGTLQVAKVPSGTAAGSGTDLLSSTIDMSGTANTVTAGTLSSTKATLELADGDGLQLVDGGTLTSQDDLCVTIGLHWIS